MDAGQAQGDPLVARIEAALPVLRRHARALSGSQAAGDALTAAVLAAVIEQLDILRAAPDLSLDLFALLHRHALTATHGTRDDATEVERVAVRRLARLTPKAREVLLLRALCPFDDTQIAQIASVPVGEVPGLLAIARREVSVQLEARVLIVEDEPLIAMDLEALVEEVGSSVVALARTEAEAIAAHAAEAPDLVLMDIRLADGSSGTDAAARILERDPTQPLIFITAYPEQLLTGLRPEPTFLITKPFNAEQVRAMMSHALFFSAKGLGEA